MTLQPDDEDALVRDLLDAVFPCEPCMAARIVPDRFTHECTGTAALPNDRPCPCPCTGGES